MIDIRSIPKNPGCYLFKDPAGTIIYVGKAKDLHKRVSSYFLKKDHDAKTAVLVSQISSMDFIATANELEAFVLENNLIKKHNPKYNINLKDSKRYAYLEMTGEEYPRLITARSTHPTTKNGKLFGPFISGAQRSELTAYLTKAFKIRTCRRLPKKACLRYHLNLCDAPCISAVSKEDYLKKISSAENILLGKGKEVVSELKEEMKRSSSDKEYERALELRYTIDSLTHLTEKQNMERDKNYDEAIINYCIKKDTVYLLLFDIFKGILERKSEFVFAYDQDFLEEFIIQYYSDNPVPKELILPTDVNPTTAEFLNKTRRKNVVITVPERGEKKQLLDLVAKNIELIFFSAENKLSDLKDVLNLPQSPMTIECFDISHLSGTAMVASMVQFKNAVPNKDSYRRFAIKTVEGIDDFAAIAEVVHRRYSRLVNEKTQFPDLIVIDGGIGQLNAAVNELNKLNIRIPIISIAKENEEIYAPGNSSPLRLDKKSSALHLVCAIRDEAHRFAIGYNKLLRKKKMFE